MKKLIRMRSLQLVKLALFSLFFLLSCHEKRTQVEEPLQIRGFVETPGYARGIQVVGNYAYIAASQAGVAILDISDPSSPYLISTLDWVQQDVARAVFKEPEDTLLYLADTDDGIPIISVSNIDSLKYVGSYWDRNILDIYGTVMDSSLFLCVADQDNGLRVLEAAVAGFLVERGLPLQLPGTPRGVFARDHTCFVADAELGLQIVDISNPDSKVIIGAADTPGYAYGVFVKDTLAFVADGHEGLSIINVADSTNPKRIGVLDLPGLARNVIVVDTLAFVACGSGGVSMVNVKDPQNPILVSTLNLPYTYDVDVKARVLFVATRAGMYTISF